MPIRLPSSRGSGTGSPLSTDHASAQSATERAIGPTVSSAGTSGNTPSVVIAPNGVLKPTTPQAAAGTRTEPPVSVPSASAPMPTASAAALPLLEPPVMRPGRCGFCVSPQCAFWPLTPHANSSQVVVATTIAPSASSARTLGAVDSAIRSA